MSKQASVWIASDPTDAARVAKVSAVGDLIFDGAALYVVSSTGTAISASGASYTLPQATTSVLGGVNLASDAEVAAGTNATKAITPLTLKNNVAGLIPIADTTNPGRVFILASGGLQVNGQGGISINPSIIGPILPVATASATGVVKAIPTASFPARTDSSGGTSGGNTIGAVTDFPSAANAVATLQAEIAQLRAALVTAGIIV